MINKENFESLPIVEKEEQLFEEIKTSEFIIFTSYKNFKEYLYKEKILNFDYSKNKKRKINTSSSDNSSDDDDDDDEIGTGGVDDMDFEITSEEEEEEDNLDKTTTITNDNDISDIIPFEKVKE